MSLLSRLTADINKNKMSDLRKVFLLLRFLWADKIYILFAPLVLLFASANSHFGMHPIASRIDQFGIYLLSICSLVLSKNFEWKFVS
jgi:hypothetical protein